MAGPQVPGYDVVRRLAHGPVGESWLAREQATGDEVALDLLAGAGDPATRDLLRRDVAALAGVDHPHLLRPRSVVGLGETTVLVSEVGPGASLADLLAVRGRLTPGEVVTVAVPLSQALAALHARGLVHGRVGADCVHLDADGRPLLGGAGLSRLLDVPAGPADDVHGLAVACLTALLGQPPHDLEGRRRRADGGGPVQRALERGLAPAAGDRPGAAELGRAVFAAASAAPLATAPAAAATPRRPGHRPGRGRRRRPPRRRPVTAGLLAGPALAVAAVTGVAWASAGGGPAPSPVHAGPRPAADWAGVLDRLDAARSRAFAAADPAALSAVYAAGGPALARDRAAVVRLAEAGLRVRDLRLDTVGVVEVGREGRRVRLRVEDVLAGHRLVDGAGRVVASRPGRGRASWTVTLTWSAGRWLVYDVASA